MLKKSKLNCKNLNLEIDILNRDAYKPWINNCCLITDFPADRSWFSNIKELSLDIFNCWVPFIKSFCVIFPTQLIDKLPKNITITKKIKFTANRTIVIGTVESNKGVTV